MQEKENHKGMNSSPEFTLSLGQHYVGDADPSTGGVLIATNNRRSHYGRGPKWRAELNDPILRIADVKEIKEVSKDPNYEETSVGGEIELYGWDPATGDMFRIYADDSQVLSDLREHNNGVHFEELTDFTEEHPGDLNFSAEFLECQIEINFKHNANPIQRSIGQARALRALAVITEKNGKRILPIGALPHRQVKPTDVNPDSYVQRIVFQHMTWNRAQHFIGTSFQIHTEMFDSETALRSINYLQQTAPILLGLSASSPFVKGKVTVSNKEVPGSGSEYSKWQSVRFLERKFGSPSGGAIKKPAPDSLDEYYKVSKQLLEADEIPTTARTLGHHVSFRFRDDLLTLEFADPDNFGAHVEKLVAFSEFNKALTMKIQAYIYQRREDELPKELFGKLDDEKLQLVEKDFVSISRYGMAAAVHQPDGTIVSAQEQFERLLAWVSNPDESYNYGGLTEAVKNEMRKSAEIISEDTFTQNSPSSEDFVNGYYRTGKGTLSQWLHKRAEHLLQNDCRSEEEAVVICMNELAEAYHEYIKDSDLESRLVRMFE